MSTTFDIGGNVRRLREARGISLSALARKAGISKAYLSQMENDPTKRPSVEIVYQLAQALGVRLTELIGLDEPEPQAGAPADRTAGDVVPKGDPADHAASDDASGAVPTIDPGQLPPGLRIFWAEHPHLPLEDIRLLASVAHRTATGPLSPTDYWLLHETIRFLRRPRSRSRQRSMPA